MENQEAIRLHLRLFSFVSGSCVGLYTVPQGFKLRVKWLFVQALDATDSAFYFIAKRGDIEIAIETVLSATTPNVKTVETDFILLEGETLAVNCPGVTVLQRYDLTVTAELFAPLSE